MVTVREKFKLTQFQDPKICFDVKGTKGGFADFKDMSIHFNLDLARTNGEVYINQTVPHEIAHLIDFQKYKGWGHKRTWKMIMQYVFGLEPKRCHNYDVSEVKKKKYDTYIYACKCREHKVKSNMHKKIALNRSKYSCATCRMPIVFKEYFGKT